MIMNFAINGKNLYYICHLIKQFFGRIKVAAKRGNFDISATLTYNVKCRSKLLILLILCKFQLNGRVNKKTSKSGSGHS